MVKHVEGKVAIVIILYVDDVLIMAKDAADRQWVKEILERQYEKVTTTEERRLPYLGMTIVKTEDGYEVCMKSYIEDILKLHGAKLREYVTPTKPNSAKFHSMVAKLLYLGKRGRPDILLPVQFLCTRVKSPTLEDQRKLERFLGYLQLTKSWTKVFDRSPIKRMETYIDASFAIHPDGKSQSGCAVFVGGTLVHETCRKQKIITRSSTEAELMALSDHIQEGKLMEEFLVDMSTLCNIGIMGQTQVIYQDNQPTIIIVTKGGGKARTKCMKVREEYVRERLEAKEIIIQYARTEQMLADVLTKPLSGEAFHNIARLLLGRVKFQTSSANNRGAKDKVAQTANDEAARTQTGHTKH
jgi:hypothetical protein